MLDTGVFNNLRPMPALPDPLQRLGTLQQLQTGQLQQQDIQQQIDQRRIQNEKSLKIQAILSAAKPDPEDGHFSADTIRAIAAVDPTAGDALLKAKSDFGKTRQEISASKTTQEDSRVNTQKTQAEIPFVGMTDNEKQLQADYKNSLAANGQQPSAMAEYQFRKDWVPPTERLNAPRILAETRKVNAEAADLEAGGGKTEYDKQLNAFNADPVLTAKYGKGPMGLAAKQQADRTAQSVATAQAETPGKIALAQATAQAMQGNDPRLAGVALKDQEGVKGKAYKAEEDYIKSQQSTDAMNATLDDARKGNKVAYSFTPSEGALYMTTSQGVKRVNLFELQGYGGAGSAVQRLQGWLGKQLTGESIPPEILKDMQQLTDSIGHVSKAAHDRTLQAIDKTYGSKFAGDVAVSGPKDGDTTVFKTGPLKGKTGVYDSNAGGYVPK